MRQVFTLVPADISPAWMLYALGVLLAVFVGLHLLIARQPRNLRLAVSDAGLEITGGWYGRTIPLEALRVAEGREINLTHQMDYRPRWRTNGIGMPGYRAGWFRLRNGEKALAFLTDGRRAVYLPTTEGYVVLASVADPRGFLEALAGAASGGTPGPGS